MSLQDVRECWLTSCDNRAVGRFCWQHDRDDYIDELTQDGDVEVREPENIQELYE